MYWHTEQTQAPKTFLDIKSVLYNVCLVVKHRVRMMRSKSSTSYVVKWQIEYSLKVFCVDDF